MKIPLFPGKYHQNGGFSMAMLVYRRVWYSTFNWWQGKPCMISPDVWVSSLNLSLRCLRLMETGPCDQYVQDACKGSRRRSIAETNMTLLNTDIGNRWKHLFYCSFYWCFRGEDHRKPWTIRMPSKNSGGFSHPPKTHEWFLNITPL